MSPLLRENGRTPAAYVSEDPITTTLFLSTLYLVPKGIEEGGSQRMRCLDGTTDSMDMSLSKL